MRTYLVGLGLGLLLASSALALHGTWQDHYSGADGARCCGVKDCQQIEMRIVRIDDGTVTVEFAAGWIFPIPRTSFHLSEDAHDWWCARNPAEPPSTGNTRCVFKAIGA
jgi:hypothetical protein